MLVTMDTWYKKESLPENVGTWIFDEGAQVNDVLGPYFENESYSLAKLDSLAMMPDSVKAQTYIIKTKYPGRVGSIATLGRQFKNCN